MYYVIVPALEDENIATIERDEGDPAAFDFAVKHGYIWETKEQAEYALKAFSTFGRRYRMAHES
jgi:hypothetical protein